MCAHTRDMCLETARTMHTTDFSIVLLNSNKVAKKIVGK
jgi:hypothetical protein